MDSAIQLQVQVALAQNISSAKLNLSIDNISRLRRHVLIIKQVHLPITLLYPRSVAVSL